MQTQTTTATTAAAAIATAQHLGVLGLKPDSTLAEAATRDLIERGGLEAWEESAEVYARWFKRPAHRGGFLGALDGGLWIDGLDRLRALEREAAPLPVACVDWPMNLEQARCHPERAFLRVGDVVLSDLRVGELAARWLRLLGFDQPGPHAPALLRAADVDFWGDLSLVLALAGCAADFRVWWCRDSAAAPIYEMTMATGSEAWAAAVLARVPDEWANSLPQ